MDRAQARRLHRDHSDAVQIYRSVVDDADGLPTQSDLTERIEQAFPTAPAVFRRVITAELIELAEKAQHGNRYQLKQEADESALRAVERVEKAERLLDDKFYGDRRHHEGTDAADAAAADGVRQGHQPDWVDSITFEDGTSATGRQVR